MTARIVTTKAEPGSPEWLQLVTASKVPAILGISRFKSQFELWHEMAGILPPAPIDDAKQELFDYGHAAELAAAEFWKYRNPGWRLSRGEVQYTRDELPFPNAVTIDRRGSRGRSRRVVEVKTAKSLEEWGDDGSGETPQDYAAQVLFQQIVTGWHDTADLVVWPDYGRPRVYPVEYDEAVAAAVIGRIVEWCESLAAGTPPELDDTVSCYETVRRLHPDIDRDTAVELDPVFAVDYLRAVADDKEATTRLRGMKTRLLDRMGRAQYARVGVHKIADRRNGKGESVSLYAANKTNPEEIEELYL
ncbi:hypothetical protein GS462_21665 [Rhodococcus hoagii]|nr:hypothetical protein [Prescottella equi]MBM4527229.1 hypothetical protein [Prescottella equi]MBM4653005.1 hypothetical protein [Prescottella equi]MBM4687725.1 hypothetical protein [Prescottella equi]